jgi:alpha-beta hydrolase superfamily lysophospholipase
MGGTTHPGTRSERTAALTRDGVTLALRLLLPPTPGPAPCVLFVHGLGSGKDSPRNVVIAERLVDAGIAALLFDLSGHGESSFDPRGEDIAAYVDDTAAVAAWARARPEIAGDRLGVSGSSLGAIVALEAQRRGVITPRAIVLRAPPVQPGGLDAAGEATLVIAGSLDPLSAAIRRAARGTLVTVEVVPGASHLFEEPGALDNALDLTVAWFKDRLLA